MHFLGICQNVNLWVLELTYDQQWIYIDPSPNTLMPGEDIDFPVYFDANDLLPGFYYAEIQFETNPNVGEPVVDVTLEILGLSPPINLYATCECTDVCLYWETMSGSQPDYFKIYRDGVFIDSTIANFYCDSLVMPEVEFIYEVTAVYDGGESMPCSGMGITVPMPEDLVPIEPVCQSFDDYNEITWYAPTGCLPHNGYYIYRDGLQLNQVPYPDEIYIDEQGSLFNEYWITAAYYFGESDPAQTFCFYDAVRNMQEDEIEVYPNPVESWFVIRSGLPLKYVEIYNNLGDEVNNVNIAIISLDSRIGYQVEFLGVVIHLVHYWRIGIIGKVCFGKIIYPPGI